MKRVKTLLALLACIVLFAAAVVLTLFLSPDTMGNSQNGSPIVLSEILASNRTYPSPNGQFLDYIEVCNISDSPVDISGYMLGDQEDSVGYTFPKGTVLNAHSYIVCWCDKESESSGYAKFGISKKGEDIIRLYNTSNVVIDQVEVPAVNDNMPLIRDDSGSWTLGTHATPGFENTEAGFEAWLKSRNTEDISIVISEIVSGGSYNIVNGEGKLEDLDTLEELATMIRTMALCGLGKSAPLPVISTLKTFRHEYVEHIVDKKCRAKQCTALRKYVIDPNKCKGCSKCAKNCPVNAISGKIKSPYTIDPSICIKCNACRENCAFDAIYVEA